MTVAEPSAIAAFTAHGGRLDLARAAFPGRADWLDLSTGIAPWAYPVTTGAEAWTHLPSPAGLDDLEAAAAAVFGCDPAATVAVPGSDLALRLIGRILGRGSVAVVRPGYSGHVAMWAMPPTPVSVADIPGAAREHDVVVLARPNNPDGAVVDIAELEAAAVDLARRGGHLIVDEAFADALRDRGIAAQGWPGTIVLRSFGKFFGLAGLRLGFVVGPPAVVAALRQLLGDWPITGPATAIGTAAYRDHSWQAAQRARLAEASGRLDAVLTACGVRVTGGTPLYRLVTVDDAAALFTHLAKAAILTRPFAAAADRLRFGVPDNAGRARLARALDRWKDR